MRPRGVARTFGPDACRLAESCGLAPDEWQRLVLEDGLAERADGLWAASSVDVIASRQNGKNVSVEVRELYGLLLVGEWIIHTAHLFKTTRESFNRLEALVDGNADVRELLTYKVASPASGYEMRFATGGRIHFIARSRTSGRGLTGDVLVLDEAQDLDDDALGALLPTISQGPQNNPQTWFLGSAPGPQSTVWHRRRKAGREGGTPRSAFCEFSSDPDCDLDDRDAWAEGNPGFGRRLLEETVEAERQAMSDEMFARERLSVSPDLVVGGSKVIDLERWRELATSDPADGQPSVFAVDVAPLQASAAVAAGGTIGEVPAAMVVEAHPGVSWVIAKLVDLQRQHPGARFVAAPDGPAGSLFGDAERAGVTIEPVSTRDHAGACSALLAKVAEGGMRHRGDSEVEAALAGATKRDMGDGAWLWSRKSSLVDISPLVAFTLALDQAQVAVAADFFTI